MVGCGGKTMAPHKLQNTNILTQDHLYYLTNQPYYNIELVL